MTATKLVGTVWRRPFEGTEWRVSGRKTVGGERCLEITSTAGYVRHLTPRDLRRWYVRKEAV